LEIGQKVVLAVAVEVVLLGVLVRLVLQTQAVAVAVAHTMELLVVMVVQE
jgi:hypothetical protein